MTIYIIRHAEPDYARDSLTEKGWREAALLSHRLAKIPDASYYVSPLGRARDTASLTLKAVGKTAEVLPWLREFDAGYRTDGLTTPRARLGLSTVLLDARADVLRPRALAAGSGLPGFRRRAVYRAVTDDLDALLASTATSAATISTAPSGRTRKTCCSSATSASSACCSHACSTARPVTLWHHTVALPSSVTVVTSEERETGLAIFRMSRFADLSHLDAAGEAPSFFARFCEQHGDGTREKC